MENIPDKAQDVNEADLNKIPQFKKEMEEEFKNLQEKQKKLNDDKKLLSEEDNNRIKELTFLKNANLFLKRAEKVQEMIDDDIEDSQEDLEYFRISLKNFKFRAVKNYEAYINYGSM